MKYLTFLLLFIASLSYSQIRPNQVKGTTPIDSVYVLVTDTADASTTKGLGIWKNAFDFVNERVTAGGTDTYANIEVDNVDVSTNAPTIDWQSTDFIVSESPTDEFNITIEPERIQDVAGAMVTGNTEAGITFTYNDGTGKFDMITDDVSATNELNTIEEGNVSVQTSNSTIDFQTLFDVATDGAGEVNVSLDMSEATTVTTPEADDYMLMHDSGIPQHQKILWSDIVMDIITFEEDNSTEGTGNDIDFQTGIDLGMTGNEADVSLDFNEFTTDPATEGDEFVIIYDPSGAVQEKVLITSLSGGFDGNGIFDSGNDGATVPTDMDVVITDHIDYGAGLLYIDEATDRVGVGTASPDNVFQVESSSQQELRVTDLTGAADVYWESNIDAANIVNSNRFYNKDAHIDISGDYYQVANITVSKTSATLPGGTINFNLGYDSLLLDQVMVIGSRETGATDGYVNIAGGLRYKWTDDATTSFTLNTGHYGLRMTNTSAKTVNLPQITSGNRGQFFTIFNDAASGVVTITPFAGNTIVGTATLNPNESCRIEAASTTKWIIIN